MVILTFSWLSNVHPLYFLYPVGTLLLLWALLIIWFYRRTRANEALVRTGFGGTKIVLDGGFVVLPILHTASRISMETLSLCVECKEQDALMTKDHYKVDLVVNSYVRVEKKKECVEKVARSLGSKPFNYDSVMDLVHQKIVGALVNLVSSETLQNLHENRQSCVDALKNGMAKEFQENGLFLESVFITRLDQASPMVYREENIFEAQGIKRIAEISEKVKREKMEILRQTELEAALEESRMAVEKERMKTENEKKRLAFEKEREFALAEHVREIDKYRAEQESQKNKFRIEQEEEVEKRNILKAQNLAEAELAKQTHLVAWELERETSQLHKEMELELKRQENRIVLMNKQKEVEAAEMEQQKSKQAAITMEAIERARRDGEVALIEQNTQSEKERIAREKEAEARAYENIKKAESSVIVAQQEALAIERLSEAYLKKGKMAAEAESKLIEARNSIRHDVLVQQTLLNFVERLPEIVRQTMKPVEKIGDAEVLNIDSNGHEALRVDRAISSMLQSVEGLPLFQEMLGFSNVDVDNLPLSEIARKAIQTIPGFQHLAEPSKEQGQVHE